MNKETKYTHNICLYYISLCDICILATSQYIIYSSLSVTIFSRPPSNLFGPSHQNNSCVLVKKKKNSSSLFMRPSLLSHVLLLISLLSERKVWLSVSMRSVEYNGFKKISNLISCAAAAAVVAASTSLAMFHRKNNEFVIEERTLFLLLNSLIYSIQLGHIQIPANPFFSSMFECIEPFSPPLFFRGFNPGLRLL